jgi:hypothetical protein
VRQECGDVLYLLYKWRWDERPCCGKVSGLVKPFPPQAQAPPAWRGRERQEPARRPRARRCGTASVRRTVAQRGGVPGDGAPPHGGSRPRWRRRRPRSSAGAATRGRSPPKGRARAPAVGPVPTADGVLCWPLPPGRGLRAPSRSQRWVARGRPSAGRTTRSSAMSVGGLAPRDHARVLEQARGPCVLSTRTIRDLTERLPPEDAAWRPRDLWGYAIASLGSEAEYAPRRHWGRTTGLRGVGGRGGEGRQGWRSLATAQRERAASGLAVGRARGQGGASVLGGWAGGHGFQRGPPKRGAGAEDDQCGPLQSAPRAPGRLSGAAIRRLCWPRVAVGERSARRLLHGSRWRRWPHAGAHSYPHRQRQGQTPATHQHEETPQAPALIDVGWHRVASLLPPTQRTGRPVAHDRRLGLAAMG